MDLKVAKFKDDLKTQGLKGLALDIDETLSDTNTHWVEHMFQFHVPENMTKEDVIGKYKFVEKVPEWQTEETSKHIEEMIHSNEFNESVPLIKGADKFVNEIHKIIPIVAYITARPETVVEGTLKWLKKHGFPEAELIVRSKYISLENFNLEKNRWKAGVLRDLFPEVVGIVDDNVLLAHELEKLNYEGTLYLYGSQVEAFDDKKGVVVCPAWPDVLDAIRSRSGLPAVL